MGDLKMNNSIDAKNSITLLLANHQHIHENIKFADQKAMVFIALNTGLLGIIYPILENQSLAVKIIGLGICSVLLVGIGMGVFVIRPRGGTMCHDVGVIDPNRISRFELNDYLNRAEGISSQELLVEIRTFIYERAKTNVKKYKIISRQMLISMLGWTIALILIFWLKYVQ